MKTQIVKIKHLAVLISMALAGIGGSGTVTPVNALTFNFTRSAATTDRAFNGFNTAGNLWSSLFTDNVTINIKIDYSKLGDGILGQASTTGYYRTYQDVYNALNSDKTTADDTRAVSSLSNSSTFKTLINHTSDNLNGSGSLTAYTYDGSDVLVMSANAKALGLIANNDNVDANISFSNLYDWDFDRSDGIAAGSFDFVGVAAHEIGHALGFVSRVDYVDGAIDTAKNSSVISTLDLFRYSTASKDANAIDMTAGTSDKYFSLDKGVTKIASFATGMSLGDSRQASHWKDNLGLGIMDPTSAPGELLQITDNDAQALDVIGWNRVSATATAVPEPADFVGTFIGAAFGVGLVLKRRKLAAKSSSISESEQV